MCGFGARIHCVRVDIRPIRTKKYAVTKVSGFLQKGALVWTEKCIEMLHCQTKRISVDRA